MSRVGDLSPPSSVEAPGHDLVQARLQLALEAAHLGLWDWDTTTGAMAWDDRSRELFGLVNAELTGTVTDIEAGIHPDDLDRVQASLTHAIETCGSVDIEFRVVHPDGSARWLYARGRALMDATGQVVRVIGCNLDVTGERTAMQERTDDAQRMAGLVAVAQALGEAESALDVLDVVSGRGTVLLGAAGVVLCVVEPATGQIRTLTTSSLSGEGEGEVAIMAPDAPLPMIHTSVTGEAHFFTDREAALERFPQGEDLYAQSGTHGSAAVPLRANGRVFGALSVAFDVPYAWRDPERELLEAFAALTAQALDRIHARESERRSAAEVARMSETLQRSLLSHPTQPDQLQIAVRYSPAAHYAQVGGDWYDAFTTRDGATCLVIGDVTGHDREAAAAMGQLRNLLRGIGYAVGQPPALVLSVLDHAARDLPVDAMATLVLAQVDQDPAARESGVRVLRWSSAGHLPPLLIHPDSTVELLDTEPDLLLGLDPETRRHDHEVVLDPGSTVLLYTDGLVERRGLPLDQGLEWLVGAIGSLADLPLEDLCDALLAQLPDAVEDDVALLAVRAHPHDGPRAGHPGQPTDREHR